MILHGSTLFTTTTITVYLPSKSSSEKDIKIMTMTGNAPSKLRFVRYGFMVSLQRIRLRRSSPVGIPCYTAHCHPSPLGTRNRKRRPSSRPLRSSDSDHHLPPRSHLHRSTRERDQIRSCRWRSSLLERSSSFLDWYVTPIP